MNPTIVAVATPPGKGGVGMVRLSGPVALNLAQAVTRHAALSPRHAYLSHWYDAQSEIIDHGIVLFFQAPHSFTGEDVIEFQGHGSPVLLQALVDVLIEQGAMPAEPGGFSRQAVENGKIDLSQAEAIAATVDAATLRAARQAQTQLAGTFGQAIAGLMDALIDVLAHLEASLDFPDEDLPPMMFEQLEDAMETRVLVPIRRLLATADYGERLTSGALVVLAGAPNVGKSSLLNYMVGHQRAIVSQTAGTTRDTIEVDFELQGVPVRLVDTAGLRDSDNALEQEGIARTQAVCAAADVIVHIAAADNTDSWTAQTQPHIRLMNKIDLAEGNASFPDGVITASVVTGEGVEDFLRALATHLIDLDAAEEPLVVTQKRHRHALVQARESLEQGLALLQQQQSLDIVALEWRRAWAHLGDILGLNDVEHILDRVFSTFCIGK